MVAHEFVELLGIGVPKSQQFLLSFGQSEFALLPFAGGDSLQDGSAQFEKFQGEFGEGAHRAHRKREELVFGEGVDNPAGDTAVSLPVGQKGVRGDDGFVVHFFRLAAIRDKACRNL